MTHLPHRTFKKLWKLKPIAATDCVVVKDSSILLVKRATPPFKGWWCLPGGIMNVGETTEQAALRELKEETGVTAKIISLVGGYSGPKRAPRGTTVAVCYLMKTVKFGRKRDNETSDIKFFHVNKLPERIGFDHRKMIKDALKLLKENKKRD